jgi:hypothetical protein
MYMLALVSRYIVLVYHEALVVSVVLLAVIYFHVSGGRPALPVPSPAATSLMSLL